LSGPTAIVVGAGVFGAATADRLAASGWSVTLVETDEPGHVRATSSGHTRVIRYGHGPDLRYVRMAWRARELWRDLENDCGQELFLRCGVLWLAREADGWETVSEATLRAEGIPVERLGIEDAARLYPSFSPDGLVHAMLEPEAGVLRARQATRALVDRAVARGALLVRGRATPADGGGVLVDGSVMRADRVVWAAGPWLGRMFPGVVDLRVVRREYLYFDAGPAWSADSVPVFYDFAGPVYGIGDVDGHGFKVAPDDPAPEFDPDTRERLPDPVSEAAARAYLTLRFPALADARVRSSRVCQYELTADNQFIAAPHPEDDGVWILGGGSGHGFKHGPALAEYVERLVDGRQAPDPRLGLGPRRVETGLRSAAEDWASTGAEDDAASSAPGSV
jgi:glycine/D-amino acid oxidase-like deaminating enzyme